MESTGTVQSVDEAELVREGSGEGGAIYSMSSGLA